MWLAWPPSQPSVAGWAFGPDKKWLLKMDVAGWASGPAKSGCQNQKVAAHMCAACGRFWDPGQGFTEGN